METKRDCKNIHTREDDYFCEMRIVAGVWMYDCMNECLPSQKMRQIKLNKSFIEKINNANGIKIINKMLNIITYNPVKSRAAIQPFIHTQPWLKLEL